MTEKTAHGHPNYVKIYLVLLVLFVISVLGPTLGHPTVTLVTAFGIAAVKATMVGAYFMHLNIEKRYVWFLLFVMLALLVVLFSGVSPDVVHESGRNWRHAVELRTLPVEPGH